MFDSLPRPLLSIRRLLVAAGVTATVSMAPTVHAAAAGRPIVSGGTVRTADGELLRGCHAHIARSANSQVENFFTDLNNVVKLRDEAHMNVIRISILSPGWGGHSTVDARISTVDAIVDNCEAAGIYAIVNYHGPVHYDDPDDPWDLKHFWSVYAPRYKDKPFVIYDVTNETFPPTTPDILPENGWTGLPALAAYIAQTAKDVIRPAAPDQMIFHCQPVGVSMNWGPYLVDTYAPMAGITWDTGKDVWSFHTYGPNIPNTAESVLATMDYGAGIPALNTEFSLPEEGWSNASFEDCHLPGEWLEKNGISWMVWQEWQSANPDQLESIMNYLLPNATTKGWDWWNTAPPSAPQNLAVEVVDAYSVALTWVAPSDPGSGVVRYHVYRDGVEVSVPNAPTGLSFTDTGLRTGSTYSYEVAAVTLGGTEGARSASAQVTTPADVTPPEVTMVSGAGDGKMVQVVFSEPVDPAGAENAANYALDNGISITAAALLANGTTVKLTTSLMTKGQNYALTISNVTDLATNPNALAPNTVESFTCIDGITKIRYCPRITFTDRMEGGVFEGSNGSPESGPYTVFHRIGPSETRTDQWNAIVEFNSGFDIGYRHVRYRGPDGARCSIADMDFWFGNVKATGTPFGSQASGPTGAAANVFDGNIQTFYDAFSPDGGYVGLTLDRTGVDGGRTVNRAIQASPAIRVTHGVGALDVVVDGLSPHAAARLELYSTKGELRAHADATTCAAGCLRATFRPLTGVGHCVVVVKTGTTETIRRLGWIR